MQIYQNQYHIFCLKKKMSFIKIVVDELTKDVSLVITDFAEEDEIDEAKMLWESQISDLKQVLGSS